MVKYEELQGEIAILQQNAVLQQVAFLPFPRSSNQRIEEIASIFRRDKLKIHILDAFDKTKGTFRGFLI